MEELQDNPQTQLPEAGTTPEISAGGDVLVPAPGKGVLLARLSRWPNLVILALTILFFTIAMADYKYSGILMDKMIWLLLSCIPIAAAGYIINDIYDQQTDMINKPSKVIINNGISASQAWLWYGIFSIAGSMAGFMVSYQMGFLCLAVILMLYFYSAELKKSNIKGNVLVSFLTSTAVFSTGQAATDADYSVLAIYSIMAFVISMKRELVKDMEDAEGDQAIGAQTFPIQQGMNKSVYLGFAFSLLLFVLCGLNGWLNSGQRYWLMWFQVGLVIFPTLVGDLLLLFSKKKETCHLVSLILKAVMVIGMLSILLVDPS